MQDYKGPRTKFIIFVIEIHIFFQCIEHSKFLPCISIRNMHLNKLLTINNFLKMLGGKNPSIFATAVNITGGNFCTNPK